MWEQVAHFITAPDASDYYQQLFRLRGLDYPKDTVERPQYFGVVTNDTVYKRLAPGVLAELQKVIPRNESGRPTAKYFQKLTTNVGYPKLREHLGAVVAIMKLSTDYHDFIAKLNTIQPRYGQQMLIPFDYELEKDSGAYSERCRSAFRSDGDHDSEVMPISIPK